MQFRGHSRQCLHSGAPTGVDPEDSVHAKLILVWGCNPVSTNMHQVMLANEARKGGGATFFSVRVGVRKNPSEVPGIIGTD